MSLRHTAAVLAGTGGLAAGMILAVPGIASASTPACGSTITTSTTLTSNMNCTGDTTTDALYIGAAGVTLNLNGHKILGPGDSARTEGIVDTGATSGTSGSGGYSDVTVENGTLSNFDIDIDIEGSNGADLTGIVVKHISTTDKTLFSSTSVFGDYLDGANFNHVTSTNAYGGLVLIDSANSVVSGNKVSYANYGLYDGGGSADTWSGNTLTNMQAYDGIYNDGTLNDVIEGNTINGATSATGIYTDDAQNITVTGNTLSGLYGGVADLYSSDGTISHNTGTGDAYGIYTEDSTDDTLTGNSFGHGEYGIETDYPDSEVLTGNTTNHNSQMGIFVYTDGETGTGLSATLTSNTGNDNRYGLYSQIPTSGSGNHASGNKVVNCYNVKCVKAKGGRSPAAAPPHHAPEFRPAPARQGRQ